MTQDIRMITLKKRAILYSLMTCIIISLFFIQSKAIPAITYFPIDKQINFSRATTALNTNKIKNKNVIIWTVNSISDRSLYLRQDISLLYENGFFKGILSKWTQNTDQVELKNTFQFGSDTSLFQAISYHHGEIHLDNGQIKAIQTMSIDELFSPINPTDIDFNTQKNKINKEIHAHWNTVIHDLGIQPNMYIAIPLTHLNQFDMKNIPSLTQDQTDKVIGQLWEGLYKNYIIPIISDKSNQIPHVVPLVLFDKKRSHLIVLYELNGKVDKLYQYYPF